MVAHRLTHLVVALAFVGLAIAQYVAQLCEIEHVSPFAFRGCLVASLGLGAFVVWRVSRSPLGVMGRAIGWCVVTGGLVGFLTSYLVLFEKPYADLSFMGMELGAPGPIVLGAIVGAAVGVVIGSFARFAPALNRRAPALTCVAAWVLAAVALVFAGSYALVGVCALSATIQLASMRRARVQQMIMRPYR